jgi:hypothetical protein
MVISDPGWQLQKALMLCPNAIVLQEQHKDTKHHHKTICSAPN